jgi:hypothetical protein
MATFRQHPNGQRVVEISDLGLVVSVLGLAAAAVAVAWVVTRDHRSLRELARLADSKSMQLLHRGGPLLP